MKPLLASQGIVPLEDFKSHASRILHHQQFLEDVDAGMAELDAGQFFETSQVKEILAGHRKQRGESQ